MRARRILHRGNQLLGEFLAELHAPLVERVDAPDDALRKNLVLVQGDQLAERGGVELLEQADGAGAAALVSVP